ncbi:60S ribosomal protein L36 [Platanthera guangdongensis]|uniref:60S ribosomal protein L36 n=1 Tax=Platanthera guangdongensis TaxID=2320717 RepID=A0ABR2LXN8_9ASPA
MAPAQPKSGLLVGLNKGHVITRRELPPRPSSWKGVESKIPYHHFSYDFNLFSSRSKLPRSSSKRRPFGLNRVNWLLFAGGAASTVEPGVWF